jgi:ABC-type multidrug transport system fused ATPase/permease subunit
VITESLIQQGLEKLTSGRTTFIIAHRFSTVRDADRIVLLERGTVSGIGTHEALMEENPGYRKLYEKLWVSSERGAPES